MSFFDPQQVYRKGTFYTKKGQILQKRPVQRDGPLSVKDRDKAIRIVKAFGYNVYNQGEYPPPQPISTIYEKGLSLPFFLSLTTTGSTNVSVTFNQLFSNIGNSLDSLLVYDDKAIDVSIDTYINSIYLYTSQSASNVNIKTSKIDNVITNSSTSNYIYILTRGLDAYRVGRIVNGGSGFVYVYNYAVPNNLNVLGYHQLNDIESYQQLCNNHQIDDDFDVLQLSVSSGQIASVEVQYNISIRVQYLDDAEPYQ